MVNKTICMDNKVHRAIYRTLGIMQDMTLQNKWLNPSLLSMGKVENIIFLVSLNTTSNTHILVLHSLQPNSIQHIQGTQKY